MTRIPCAPVLAVLVTAFLVTGCHNRATSSDGNAPEVTGSGAVVDAAEVDGERAVRMEELLIGRFPGVRVIVEPGGGFSVRVWGPSSMAGRDPLYVVDGMPVSVTPGRGVDWLNPADIETIRVLKDISDTSAYGVRGANGVVVITTRRGG